MRARRTARKPEYPFTISHVTYPTEASPTIRSASPDAWLDRRNALLATTKACEPTATARILQVYLRRSRYEAVVGEKYRDAAAAEIVPRFGTVRSLLEQFVMGLGNGTPFLTRYDLLTH